MKTKLTHFEIINTHEKTNPNSIWFKHLVRIGVNNKEPIETYIWKTEGTEMSKESVLTYLFDKATIFECQSFEEFCKDLGHCNTVAENLVEFDEYKKFYEWFYTDFTCEQYDEISEYYCENGVI